VRSGRQNSRATTDRLAFQSEGQRPATGNRLRLFLLTVAPLMCLLSPGSAGGTATGAGQLFVAPSSVTFGDVELGSSGTQSVQLSNIGGAGLTVSQATLSGPGFSLSGLALSLTLAPGQSTTFSVSFAPGNSGAATGSLALVNSSAGTPLNLPLSGTGIVPLAHSVDLSWGASTSTVIGYNAYRGNLSGGPYAKITSSPAAGTTYADNAVQSGNTYFYVVTAVAASNVESVFSNEAMAVIPAKAAISSPAPGTKLAGSSASFTWTTGTAVSEYWLWIGTAPGTLNLYDANQDLRNSVTVNGLPADGSILNVRLFSWINGAWQFNDYTYAAAGGPTAAVMTSPTPGATLSSPVTTFTWSRGVYVVEYWLWIGTSPGTLNLYDANQGTNASATVNGLPVDGQPIYVRLFSWINNAWQYNDYTYTAASPSAATMISPPPGSTFPGSTVAFTWTQSGASEYWLWIGTSPGARNLYDANQATNTSATVNGLPTNGSTIYVRLYSWINSAWQYNDYSYTALN